MLKVWRFGDYNIISENEIANGGAIIDAIQDFPDICDLGRGRVKFVSLFGEDLVIRQYVHGGILRCITGERYLSPKRAVRELLLLSYLRKNDFPCPDPYCAVIEKGAIFKKLYLVTRELKNCKPLTHVLKETKGLKRARHMYVLAKLLRRLFDLKVFHPDFHLSNVLVRNSKELYLVDFDRAKVKKRMDKNEVLKMIIRLYRYSRALEKKGEITLEKKEKIFFLKVCGRIFDHDIIHHVRSRLKKTELTQNLGWFLESKIYRRKK